MNASDLKQTLTELAACAEAWQPQARLVGNVTAGAIYEAAHRALAAVEFVERYGENYATALEIHTNYTDLITRVRDDYVDVLHDGAWARRVGFVREV